MAASFLRGRSDPPEPEDRRLLPPGKPQSRRSLNGKNKGSVKLKIIFVHKIRVT